MSYLYLILLLFFSSELVLAVSCKDFAKLVEAIEPKLSESTLDMESYKGVHRLTMGRSSEEILIIKKREGLKWMNNDILPDLQGSPYAFVRALGPNRSKIGAMLSGTIGKSMLAVPGPKLIRKLMVNYQEFSNIEASINLYIAKEGLSTFEYLSRYAQKRELPLSTEGRTLAHDLYVHGFSFLVPISITKHLQKIVSLYLEFEAVLDKIDPNFRVEFSKQFRPQLVSMVDGLGNFSYFATVSKGNSRPTDTAKFLNDNYAEFFGPKSVELAKVIYEMESVTEIKKELAKLEKEKLRVSALGYKLGSSISEFFVDYFKPISIAADRQRNPMAIFVMREFEKMKSKHKKIFSSRIDVKLKDLDLEIDSRYDDFMIFMEKEYQGFGKRDYDKAFKDLEKFMK